MHNKQDASSCPVQDQAELINKLLFYEWSDMGPQIRRTLLVFLNTYMGSDPCEAATPEVRQEIAYHVIIISEITDKLEELERLNLKKTA